jgi:hypothetical protein
MLVVNPDGRKKAETGLSWRKNTNQNYCGATSNSRGADLNRNFTQTWNATNGSGSSGNQCDSTYRGPTTASEPETRAVEAYARSGTSDNVSYGELGVAAYTIELGTSFFQSCSTYTNTIKPKNLPALLYAAKVVRTPYLTPTGPDVTKPVFVPNAATTAVTAGTNLALSSSVTDTRFPHPSVCLSSVYVDISILRRCQCCMMWRATWRWPNC